MKAAVFCKHEADVICHPGSSRMTGKQEGT
jgi:hypothetical protein